MEKKEMRDRLVQLCVKAYMFGSEQVIIDLPSLIGFVEAELDKAREGGIREALEETNRTLGTNVKYINGEYKVVFRRVSNLVEDKQQC